MGQANSRGRRPQQPPQQSPSTDTAAEASTADRAAPNATVPPSSSSNPKRQRRSSLRKSLLNLVKPPKSSPSKESPSSDPASRHKSRHSRRWNTPRPTESAEAESSTAPAAASSAADELPTPTLDKREDEDPPQPTSDSPAAEGDATDAPPTETISPQIPSEEAAILPDATPQDLPAPSPESPAPAAASFRQVSPGRPGRLIPPAPRQFPPAGTLVVVQGVVHTTDIPRPAAPPLTAATSTSTTTSSQPQSPPSYEPPPRPSTPAGSERSAPRNRLSNLLRSGLSRPSSSASLTPPSTTEASSDSSSPEIPSPSSSSTTPADTTDANNDPHVPTISSSSIDVLGTLLSVAAAATAASLLTGSAPPVLNAGEGTPAPLFPPSTRQETSAAENGRMRQAWGSLRERIGLRPTTAPPTANAEASPLAQQDARERMLAEMARAFNLGLGLTGDAFGATPNRPATPAPAPASATNPTPAVENGEGGEAPTPHVETPAPTPTPTPAPRVAPEGSFERFLVDLQADLRLTLAESPPISAEESERPPAPSDGDDDEMPALDPADIPLPEDTPAIPLPSPPRNDRINWWRLYRFPAITAPPPSRTQENTTPPSASAEATVNTPETTADAASPSTSSTPSAPPSQPSNSTDPSAPTQTNTNANAEAPRPNVVIPVIVVGLQSVNVRFGNDGPATAVPSAPQQEMDDAEAFGVTPDASSTSASPANNPASAPGATAAPTPAENDRGRRDRWLHILRNLRSNSGPAPAAAVAAPAHPNAAGRTFPPGFPDLALPGSRTFLIYVIGGYYPPDHSIVTGENHNLDSFEALLDLAELLGQVKPPTVSQEEIENSGLKVIRTSELKQCEKDGAISSNCVDRCLICLEDYEEESRIRVMSCRHAFHQECVDRWLQTGKNNCPACRSKGVSPEGPSPTPAPVDH